MSGKLGLTLALSLVVLTGAAFAEDSSSSIYVVHGIPGSDLGLPASLPVDITVNGACAIQNFEFGDITDSISLPAGTYTVEVRLANAAAPCSGPVAIGPADLPFAAGKNYSVVAHLTEDGKPTASLFENDLSPTGRGMARLIAHHTAAAPVVDVRLSRATPYGSVPLLTVEDFGNGDQAAASIRPGGWEASLLLPNTNTTAIGPVSLRFSPFTAYLVYAVGSVGTGSFTFLIQPVYDLK
jgi:hypothetical protein